MLKGLIYKIIEDIFPNVKDIRFRPSYFPFTEPSAKLILKTRMVNG